MSYVGTYNIAYRNLHERKLLLKDSIYLIPSII